MAEYQKGAGRERLQRLQQLHGSLKSTPGPAAPAIPPASGRALLEEMRPPRTLAQKAQQDLGIDPTLDRATFLPIARNPEGGMEFALPQVAVDMAQSALLPGHVMEGGEYTPQDVTRMGLDYTGGKALGTMPGRRRFIKEAPAPEQVKQTSLDFLGEAKKAGVRADPVQAADFVTDTRAMMTDAGFRSKKVTPKAMGVLKEWEKDAATGNAWDLDDILLKRREAGHVAASLDDTESLAGVTLKDAVDDFVENLSPQSVGGGPNAAELLKNYRRLYTQQAKANDIAELIANAQMSASGFENGIRNEARRMLKNKRRIRGYTMEERKMLQDIESGDLPQRLMRLVSHFGFPTQGSNRFLGLLTGGVGAPAYIGNQVLGLDPLTTAGLSGLTIATGTGAGQLAAMRQGMLADTLKASILRGGAKPMGAGEATVRRMAGPTVGTTGLMGDPDPANLPQFAPGLGVYDEEDPESGLMMGYGA